MAFGVVHSADGGHGFQAPYPLISQRPHQRRVRGIPGVFRQNLSQRVHIDAKGGIAIGNPPLLLLS